MVAEASQPFYPAVAIPRVSTDARRDELESAARRLLEALLTPNLQGVKRVCDGKESRFEFVAPIQVIYWRVADLAGSPYLRQSTATLSSLLAMPGKYSARHPREFARADARKGTE